MNDNKPVDKPIKQYKVSNGNTVVKRSYAAGEKPWRPNASLTVKENMFVKHVVENPKDNYTDAAVSSYNASTRAVAAVIATQLRRKPQVMAELAKYTSTAEANLVKLANATTDYALEGGKDGAAYAGVAERVNNSILDRIHGKATQKIEQTGLAVTLNVDLSAAG